MGVTVDIDGVKDIDGGDTDWEHRGGGGGQTSMNLFYCDQV
jgi:hypothetical protein